MLVSLLLVGLLLNQQTKVKDDLTPLEEQYSDDELAIYNAVYDACVDDVSYTYTKSEPHITVLTCQCVAKNILKTKITDNSELKKIYETSKQYCYEITVKYIGL